MANLLGRNNMVIPKIHKITKRETQILHLVAYEYSTKEIAALLFLSNDTVNSHRKNMMRKLDVKNTAGLIRVAFETGILQSRSISSLLPIQVNESKIETRLTSSVS